MLALLACCLLFDDFVYAVYLASPTSEHAKQSILLLGMGKHVLVRDLAPGSQQHLAPPCAGTRQ